MLVTASPVALPLPHEGVEAPAGTSRVVWADMGSGSSPTTEVEAYGNSRHRQEEGVATPLRPAYAPTSQSPATSPPAPYNSPTSQLTQGLALQPLLRWRDVMHHEPLT
ncbi:hypothetical protein Hamer_G008886 [Homarus americanus]|uniref:Uncharacterized protein n=1 Tax=Homarus americanus TaxID=6706 RepID=A0A8J5JPB2_HOMAM|nr:hypothetical protein Hamer_G008886 [Homarus americanus]